MFWNARFFGAGSEQVGAEFIIVSTYVGLFGEQSSSWWMGYWAGATLHLAQSVLPTLSGSSSTLVRPGECLFHPYIDANMKDSCLILPVGQFILQAALGVGVGLTCSCCNIDFFLKTQTCPQQKPTCRPLTVCFCVTTVCPILNHVIPV